MSAHRIRVLVAEDSPSIRLFLVHLLESDPRLEVIGAVGDGESAIDFVYRLRPDVLLIDLYMPGLDGFEAIRRIMESTPLPIVVCSSAAGSKELDITFRALEAGALACVQKPGTSRTPEFETNKSQLLETVRLMAEVRVVRRTVRPRLAQITPSPLPIIPPAGRTTIIGVGASTGGPPVLQAILSSLPKDLEAAILVVQHIARGFLAGMAEWLNQTSPLQVQIASSGTKPIAGHVYLAPDDFHMGVRANGDIFLTRQEPENGLRPSVAFLFRSLAVAYGTHSVGVLLTGMGKDGAEELRIMRENGAVTIAQDRETSVVHGMPGVAIAMGAATYVLPSEKIAEMLITLVNHRSHVKEAGHE